MLKTVAKHVRELKVKLATDAWVAVVQRWMHAVHLGGTLALSQKTEDTTILDGDCQEDALDLMDRERNRRWREAARELLGGHRVREYVMALGAAKRQE